MYRKSSAGMYQLEARPRVPRERHSLCQVVRNLTDIQFCISRVSFSTSKRGVISMGDAELLAITIWGVVIGLSVIFVVVRVCNCMKALRSARRELLSRINKLRIHNMLARLGISPRRYLRKARSLDVEGQLLCCEHCKTTDACDACLEKDSNVDERTFCPNFTQLETYRPIRKCKPLRVHLGAIGSA